MKKSLLILAVLISFYSAKSQSINIIGMDTTNFPNMTAMFYAYNAMGQRVVDLANTDIQIIENGTNCTNISVLCPTLPETKAVSVVLTIDVSGSMKGAGLESAKNAAKNLINTISLNKSECAITSFSDKSLLLSDFTNNKDKLLQTLELLKADGGTDYDSAFWTSFVGGLEIAKKGRNKRVLIMLTDGLPNSTPQTQKIIDLAKQYNVTVFCIVLDMYSPRCLKDIAEQTGGKCYDRVNSDDGVKDIYMSILSEIENIPPCTIEWLSSYSCDRSLINAVFNFNSLPAKDTINYYQPNAKMPYIVFNPPSIEFKNAPIGVKKNSILMITAKNNDIEVIDVVLSDPSFSVSQKNFKLKKDQTLSLSVYHTPKDSIYSFCEIKFITNTCPVQYFCSGKYSIYKTRPNTLKLVQPNGGEVYGIGTDTIIKWTGIPKNDYVSIDFSADSGKKWTNLTNSATGYEYKWKKLPDTPSDSCLVKINQQSVSDNSAKELWRIRCINGNDIKYTPDGKYIVYSITDSLVWLDAKTYDVVKVIKCTLKNNNGAVVNSFSFSPDGKRLVTSATWLTINDAETGTIISQIQVSGKKVDWSPDGKKIAINMSNKADIIIADTAGNIIDTLIGGKKEIDCFAWSPDGKKIIAISGDEGRMYLWNTVTSQVEQEHVFGNYYSNCFSIKWNSAGTKVIFNDGVLWDVSNWKMDKKLSVEGYSADWSPDGTMIGFTGGGNVGKLVVIDVNTGNIVYETNKASHFWQCELAWSPDNKKIATVGADGVLEVWDSQAKKNVYEYLGYSYALDNISYSPDGTKILTVNAESGIRVLDALTGKIVFSTHFKYGVGWIEDACWSPNSEEIAVALSDVDTIRIVNIKDASKNRGLINSERSVYKIRWSPEGTLLAVNSYNYIFILEAKTGKKLLTIPGRQCSFDWNRNGTKLAVYSNSSNDSTISVWDIVEKKVAFVLKGHNDKLTDVKWNRNTNIIASCDYTGGVKIWDPTTSKEINSFQSFRYADNLSWYSDNQSLAVCQGSADLSLFDAYSGKEMINLGSFKGRVDCNPKSNRIVVMQTLGPIKSYEINILPLQSDTSDKQFSIIAPIVRSYDVDMKQWAVGSAKDSVIQQFVVNESDFNIRVDSISITGKDNLMFSVVSGTPEYVVPAKSTHMIEFRFKPTSVGIKTADINVYTASGVINTKIQGEGVIPTISVENNIIDFGKVFVNSDKDTADVVTIKNIGLVPLKITNTKHSGPNSTDFTTKTGGGSFTLAPGEIHKMKLNFKANQAGLTNGTLEFEYDGTGSPASIILMGEGVKEFPEIGSFCPAPKKTFCQASHIDSVKVWNNGGGILEITEVSLIGANADEFKILSNPAPISIDDFTTATVVYSFNPTSYGAKEADLLFRNNSINSPLYKVELFYSSETTSFEVPSQLDFGEIQNLIESNHKFVIHNTGTSANTYVISSNSKYFNILKNNLTLAPGNSDSVVVRYDGESKESGIIHFEISVSDSTCLQTVIIPVSANMKSNLVFGIEAGVVSAKPTDELMIPIYLTNADFIKYTNIKAINAELVFNKTLLFPNTSSGSWYDEGENRVLKLAMPIENSSNGVLANIKMSAMLGNAIETPLELRKIETEGDTMTIGSVNGLFKLIGLCQEGGTRLINPTGTVRIKSITPNPSDKMIDVKIELIETTGYKIVLSNELGAIAKQVIRQSSKQGESNEILEISDLESGVYYLVLETETVRIAQKVYILK